MPIGLTYAEFVVGVIGLIWFGEPMPATYDQTGTSVTFGANAKDKDGPGHEGFLTVTAYGVERIWERFAPVYGFGASVDGAVYASFGLGKHIQVLGGTLTPFTGPALYQRDLADGFDAEELIQFRTGVDFSWPVGESSAITLGWYHMSNMKLTDSSAGIDVTHAGFVLHF